MTSNANDTIAQLRNRYSFFGKSVTVEIWMYCHSEGYLESFYGLRCSYAEDCEGHRVSKDTGTLVGVSYDERSDVAELFLRQEDMSVRTVKVHELDRSYWESPWQRIVSQSRGWTSIHYR